jgi:hypothetical protein
MEPALQKRCSAKSSPTVTTNPQGATRSRYYSCLAKSSEQADTCTKRGAGQGTCTPERVSGKGFGSQIILGKFHWRKIIARVRAETSSSAQLEPLGREISSDPARMFSQGRYGLPPKPQRPGQCRVVWEEKEVVSLLCHWLFSR